MSESQSTQALSAIDCDGLVPLDFLACAAAGKTHAGDIDITSRAVRYSRIVVADLFVKGFMLLNLRQRLRD